MRKLQIGEFAKLTRLSVKALRHYDREGLLVPASVDAATGYRYYDQNQLETADSIQVLRSLDMPLPEIKALLLNQETHQTVDALRAHHQQLREDIAAKQRSLSYLDTLIQAKKLLLDYEVRIQSCKPTRIASVQFETPLRAIGGAIQRGFGELLRGLQAAGLTPAGAPLIIYHDVIDAHCAGCVEVGVPIAAQELSSESLTLRELEGGLVAATTHTGPYQSIGPAYQALASWMVKNGYDVVGPPRERYLNDPQMTPEKELQTTVEFPVHRSTAC